MGAKGADETAAAGGATSNVDEKSESMLLLVVTGAGGAGAGVDTGAGPPNMSSNASTSVFGGCGFDTGAENVGAVLFVGAAVVGELKLSASRSTDWLDGTDGLS